MVRRDVREILAALSVVRESEAIRLQLMVSIHSSSSVHDLVDSGLGSYLKTTKRTLQVQLVVGYLKMVCGRLSKTTFTVLRAWWLRITVRLRSGC